MQGKQITEEQRILLRLARQAMESGVRGEEMPPLELDSMPARLRENGASFITLTSRGELRGCIGGLDAHQPLAQDVCEHAVAAALKDPRFPAVRAEELSAIQIEISLLTCLAPLEYSNAADLLSKLRPHIDGVVLYDDWHRRVTFLPQVWEKIPDCEEFLSNLCYKMGLEPETWRHKHFEVFTYQVEVFHE